MVGGRALFSWGRAYSFWGGACGESDKRLCGSRRGGAEGRGLEWPEVAWLLGRKPRSPTQDVPGMASPRELTQNPLKKIWMPYSNGRPALHACQRGGEAGSVEKGRAVHGDGWIGRPAQWSRTERGPGTGGEPGTGEAAVTGGRGAGTGRRPGTGVAEQGAETGMWPRLPLARGARSGCHPLRQGAGPFSPESVPIRSGQGRIRSLLLPFTSGRRAWTWSELCWP